VSRSVGLMADKPSPLKPPVLGKVFDRTKDPLPPIGSSGNSSPERLPSNVSSPSADEGSPLSGSLAVARRRNRQPVRTEEDQAQSKPSALMDILDPDVDGSPSHALPTSHGDRSPNHLEPLAHNPPTNGHYLPK
jgi:hypothetical protein